jgi:hypothetical protein
MNFAMADARPTSFGRSIDLDNDSIDGEDFGGKEERNEEQHFGRL